VRSRTRGNTTASRARKRYLFSTAELLDFFQNPLPLRVVARGSQRLGALLRSRQRALQHWQHSMLGKCAGENAKNKGVKTWGRNISLA
jgi:hypothetical protein